MALVTMKHMLREARQKGYAVGAFEFWSYDSARVIVKAAESRRVPVILQVGHFERDYMDGYRNAYRIASMVSELVDIPVALHLDHAEEYSEVLRALEAGFTSVMIDASARPYEENVYLTKEVVKSASYYGASVEAELGQLVGNEGNVSSDTDALTDPDSAANFVDETGIDALAVAIGTAHGFYKSEPHIDIARLEKIADRVEIPLVLHGGSGTPEEAVRQSIRKGISKVNICTEFIEAFGKGYIKAQGKENFTYNVETLFLSASLKAQELVLKKLDLFSPNDKI